MSSLEEAEGSTLEKDPKIACTRHLLAHHTPRTPPPGHPKGQKFKHIDSRHRVGAVDTQKITFLASEKNRNKKTVCNFDTILKKHPSVLGTLIRHDSFFVGRWQARRSAVIAPQQRTGKKCIFLLLRFYAWNHRFMHGDEASTNCGVEIRSRSPRTHVSHVTCIG